MSRREKILNKINTKTESVGECLIWKGPTSGNVGRGKGYPRMNLDGQTVAVHRVVYTHFNGYIPSKKQIDHTCNNRLCLSEGHLVLTTHKKNCSLRDSRNKSKAALKSEKEGSKT